MNKMNRYLIVFFSFFVLQGVSLNADDALYSVQTAIDNPKEVVVFEASAILYSMFTFREGMYCNVNTTTKTAEVFIGVLGRNKITKMYVNYKVDDEVEFSTYTITNFEPAKLIENKYVFPVTIKDNAEDFLYRVIVIDDQGNMGMYVPINEQGNKEEDLYSDKSFFHVNLTAPVFDTEGLGRISAVTGIAVATGQVTSKAGLNSVELFYKTDVDNNYLSIKKIISNVSEISKAQRQIVYKAMSVQKGVPANIYQFRLEVPVTIKPGARYFYYYIKAVDKRGIQTISPSEGNFYQAVISSSKTFVMDARGGSVRLPDGNPEDGETSIELSAGSLGARNNLTITEIDPKSPLLGNNRIALSQRPLAVFALSPDELVLNNATTIKLLYQDRNDDGIVDGTRYSEDELKIMSWDGIDWCYVGGKVDKNEKVVSAKVRHLGVYGVFAAAALRDEDYRPKTKIITPAYADGTNDYASFTGLEDDDIVNIYDVTGKRIRQLRGNSIWDGKDDSNSSVESGIYVYQIKTAGKIISGTIVVAK
jgi:hypothetical protein